MKLPSLPSCLFIGISLILAIDIALSTDEPTVASGQKIKPFVMERAAIKEGTKPTEMSKEEAEQLKKEKEEVKKLLLKYNEKVKKKLEKQAKKLEKDEKYQQRMKEQKDARALLPEEKRVPTLSIAEINANSADSQHLYQGDIQLTLEQANILFAGNDDDDDDDEEQGQQSTAISNASSDAVASGGRKRRGAAMNTVHFPDSKWPSLHYPFSFDSSISDQLKENIYDAIALWYNNTCLYMFECSKASPRVHFVNSKEKGCESWLGRKTSTTYQELWLGQDCDLLGIIAHEIGHSLGFFHEQSRYDRDDFLEVHIDNADKENAYNYDKRTSIENNNYGIAYDLGSVMHYHARAFSINNESTLVPKAGHMYLHTIGQRFGPSHSDYKMMNMHYCGLTFNELDSRSSRNSVKCQTETICYNDGFQNPNNCSTCICPPGYAGTKCEQTQVQGHAPIGVPNTCNGTNIRAQSYWTEVCDQKSNVDKPDLYGQIGSTTMNERADYAHCHWNIVGDSGKTIYIEVQEVGNVCSDGCEVGNTEIRTSAKRGDTGVRLCCQNDLGGPNKTLSITAPNGYAMISLYAFNDIQRFRILFVQK